MKKPKIVRPSHCPCGGELKAFENILITREKLLTKGFLKTGEFPMNPKQKGTGVSYGYGICCTECSNVYNFDEWSDTGKLEDNVTYVYNR